MESRKSIRQWAIEDRPREKLIRLGVEQLSASELLGILLQTGNRQKSAVELGMQLLEMAKQNLQELGRLNPREIAAISGIGHAKAALICAALELGRRRHASLPLDKKQVTSSADIAQFLQVRLQDLRHEVFAVLFLNRANRINHFEIVSEGGITGTVADPRIILKKALEQNAVSIIVCHNHPSGNLRPSRADELLTQKLKEAALLLDITMLDHIIVSDQGYYSFADEGYI
jgi:DNA repair protein RadC